MQVGMIVRKSTLFLLISAMGLIDTAFAQEAPVKPAVQQSGQAEKNVLLTINKQSVDSLVKKQLAALSGVLADDVQVVGADGVSMTKKAFLEEVESGRRTYISYEIAEPDVKIHGSSAVIRGVSTVTANVQGREFTGNLKYVKFVVKRNSVWKIVYWQTLT